MTPLTLTKAAGSAAQRWCRSLSASLRRPATPALISVGWFVAVFGAIVWAWGLNPKIMMSPDEALNRFAAAVISKHGTPFLVLPFADPENLAHPRHWVTVGDHAIPSYAPVALYGYALLLRFNWLGLLLVAAFPASAAAAFAAGTARLLPPRRQWLSLLAPILGFPALYWLTRPWINLSVLLICVCWSFFFWASWRQSANSRHLTSAIFGVGAAAAVRPDYAAYLLLVVLLFSVAAKPTSWKHIAALVFAAGASAVALNLFLNWLVTGHPLLAAYQIVAARDEGTNGPGGPLGLLRQLLVPMGVPTRSTALHFLGKYWFNMGTVAGLLVAQLALVPLLLAQPRLARLLQAVALLVMLCFVLSHMDAQLAGASERLNEVHHSMPRYWSPVYLLAALPPILFLGFCKNRAVLVVGAVLACALAISDGYEICKRETSSLGNLRELTRKFTQTTEVLANSIPSDAMVYSATYDKVLWSRWRVGIMAEPELTAASIRRAVDAHLDVFLYEPKFRRSRYSAFSRALRSRQLVIAPVNEQGLYHVGSEQRP